MTQLFLYWFT